MKTEEQRIAIAEACGRKPGAYYCGHCRECVPIETVTSGGYHNKCGGPVHLDLPNYLNDLNAMHEAVKTLPCEQYEDDECGFTWNLARVIYGNNKQDGFDFRDMQEATASQRAEAFLRTIGKWIEERPDDNE